MRREFISIDGSKPSPLWVPVHGPKPVDWLERMFAYTCAEGARELLVALERISILDDERAEYLTEALAAVRKLGFTLGRWLDSLDALGDEPTERLWRRALADDQSVRQRLAWELLVELIGFCATDSPAFWRHHAALLRLQRVSAKLADLDAFFDCRPSSLEARVLDAASEVVTYEDDPALDLARCWYARRRAPSTADKVSSARSLLSTQRSRFRELLVLATPTERVALGVSYHRLYSRLSRRAHFSLPQIGSLEHVDSARGHGDGEIDIETLRYGVVVVGRLGNLCLSRLQTLTGLEGGAVCRLHREVRDMTPSDPHAEMFADIASGAVRIGDFAFVHEQLAEVLAKETNALGHSRYLVHYIAERPRPEIAEEWQPATDVHTLWPRERVEGWLADAVAELPAEMQPSLLAVQPDRRLRVYARKAWEQGLRDQVLAMHRTMPPADYT